VQNLVTGGGDVAGLQSIGVVMTDAAPGWYDDGSGRQRYWDGSAWGPFADDLSLAPGQAEAAAPPAQAVALPAGYTPFVYHTELLSMSEKWVGRTGSGSHTQSGHIGQRFTSLSAQGWEFVTTTRVPVVGKVFKADDVRTLTVAIFRRPAR